MSQKPSQLEQKLRRAKVTAEVDPALHARLVARLGSGRPRLTSGHSAPPGSRWMWAGAAAALVLGISLVVVLRGPQNAVPEPVAGVETRSQPLSRLVAGLNRAPVAPPEQWLRQEMEALESDLRKLLPRPQAEARVDAATETASG